MEIRILKTAEEFEPWVSRWQELALRQPWYTAFHHPDWILTSLEADFNEAAVVLITESDRLLAGFVLCVFDNYGPAFLTRTRSVCLEPRIGTVRPNSMIAAIDPEIEDLPLAKALVRGLGSVRWKTGFFQYTGEGESRLVEALRTAARDTGCRMRSGFSSPEAGIDLNLDPAEYLKSRSPKMRDTLRNSINRLKKAGAHRFIDLGKEGAAWPEVVRSIDAVYRKCWQRTSPLSPLAEPFRKPVLAAAERFHAARRFHAWFLFLEDRPIACDLYLATATELFPILKAIDEDFREISPGSLLMLEGYRHFAGLGYRSIYYGPIKASEKTAYKAKWATREWNVPNLAFIPRRSAYGALDALYHSSGLIRKAYWKLARKGRSGAPS